MPSAHTDDLTSLGVSDAPPLGRIPPSKAKADTAASSDLIWARGVCACLGRRLWVARAGETPSGPRVSYNVPLCYGELRSPACPSLRALSQISSSVRGVRSGPNISGDEGGLGWLCGEP
ncbi:hypothetical protein NDU88_001387 [Pleurodeles waltl]|uniref:Uncharacterized protein n=1 Tax=Pleurodeles waltl TaxID=8319 RepID=A0AAV7LHA0_PLEWA|nr:hypothetical protein NDU88_001387 [Pleurodeles waltl]